MTNWAKLMMYHLVFALGIFFFADGTHVAVKQEEPTMAACQQYVRTEAPIVQGIVHAQAPYSNASVRVAGWRVSCFDIGVPAAVP